MANEPISAVGTSAGAAATAAVLLWEYRLDITGEQVCKTESLVKQDFKSMVPVMKRSIREFTPENAIDRLKHNRFVIVCSEVTSYCTLSTIESREFEKRRDIVAILCATCHIPIFGGYCPYFTMENGCMMVFYSDTSWRTWEHKKSCILNKFT